MNFEMASDIVIPFGKYNGQSIDEIAKSDDGLRYLDWLIGQKWIRGDLKMALETYLKNPTIARELDELTED